MQLVSILCLRSTDIINYRKCVLFIVIYVIFVLAPDICGTSEDDCSEFATCADTGPDAYTCTCNEGYTGDGKNCEGKKTKIRVTHFLYYNIIIEMHKPKTKMSVTYLTTRLTNTIISPLFISSLSLKLYVSLTQKLHP